MSDSSSFGFYLMWFWLNLVALFSGFALLTAAVILSRPSVSNEPGMNDMLSVLFGFFLLALLSFLASYRGVTMRDTEPFTDIVLGIAIALTVYYEWRLFIQYTRLRLSPILTVALPAVAVIAVLGWFAGVAVQNLARNEFAERIYLSSGFLLHAAITGFTLLAAYSAARITSDATSSVWRPLFHGFATACRIVAVAHLANWIIVNIVLSDVLFPDTTITRANFLFVIGYLVANARVLAAILRTLSDERISIRGGIGPSHQFLEAYNITEREQEILTLIFEGLSNAQIAERLNISVRTVDTHVSNLLRKCDAQSRLELYKRAAGTYRE